MHLLALAMRKAGSTKGPEVRKALYAIEEHAGLIKTYRKPFSPENQDALRADDYVMVRFEGDKIVPVN
jgi:branched-chain amino acid transport system substrate-binding protein